MSDFKPGTVAVATVRGVPNVRLMRTSGVGLGADHWISAENIHAWRMHTESDVTDVRPLVVLDLDKYDRASALSILSLYAKDVKAPSDGLLARIIDAVEQQTRPPKPPRIPEPGWGQKVSALASGDEAAGRREFVRWWNTSYNAWADAEGNTYRWEDLVDPVLVRDGIEDGAK